MNRRRTVLALALAPPLIGACTCAAFRTPASALDLCVVWKAGAMNRERFSLGAERCEAGVGPVFVENDPQRDAILAGLRDSCKGGDEVFDAFAKGLSGGRVTFDKDRLAACLPKGRAARASAPATLWMETALRDLAQDPDCKAVWQPLLNEGDACVEFWDCPLETNCDTEDPTQPGLRCMKPAGAGALCGLFRHCDAGHLCKKDACVPRGKDGAACSGDADCADGFFCRSSTQTCQAQGGLDQPCVRDDLSSCKDAHCNGDTQRCEPWPEDAEDGESCEASFVYCKNPCSVCRPEGTPEGTRKCQPRGKENEPCFVNDAECVAGLYCDYGGTNLCARARGNGESCASGEPCGEDLFCDAGGHCRPGKGKGEACGFEVPCASAFACAGGHCVEGKENDPCDSYCIAGLDCVGAEGARTCRKRLAAGDACAAGGPLCDTGLFCGGQGRCEPLQEAGTACEQAKLTCKGYCFKGKCAPVSPNGCGDIRDTFGYYFGMGVLFACVPRRRRGGAS